MPEQEISSYRHPLIKQYVRLSGSRRHRYRVGKFTLEGSHLIGEALRAGIVPEIIFYTRGYWESSNLPDIMRDLPGEVKCYLVTPQLFKRMALTDSPQGIAALAPMPPRLLRKTATGEPELGLLLDRIQDPGNLGTIIRTAAASAASGIYCTPGTVDPYSPKVMRSTSGAIFHLPPVLIPDPLKWLERLKNQGVRVIATGPGQDQCYWETDLRPPTVFIIGNENRGINPELVAGADQQISIPQPGWSRSLNAAVSAAILLYETLRQRQP